MASSTSGITFSGLASGLDTSSIISALVAVAQAPIDKLKTRKTDYNAQNSKFSDLNSKLSSLSTAAKALKTASEFKSYKATTSDTSKLGATASGSALPGAYRIKINHLATNERTYSDVFAAQDQTGLFGTGTLSIGLGTATPTDITVEATDTLTSLATKINEKVDGVTASVLQVGTNQYRLIVSSDNVGAANTISFTEGGTLSLNLDEAANQMQAATNSEIVVDCDAAGTGGVTISSESNTVTSAIPGVTLNLQNDVGSPIVTLTVDTDKEAIKTKISSFISSYNTVSNFIRGEFTYKGTSKTTTESDSLHRNNTLMGDATLRSIQSILKNIVGGGVTGAEPYNTLSLVGITSSRDGTLTLDSTKFEEALDENSKAVTSLFTKTDNNDATDNDGVAVRLVRSIELMIRSGDGMIAIRQSGINSSINSLNTRIQRMEDNLTTYEESLRKQYTSMELMISQLKQQQQYLNVSS